MGSFISNSFMMPNALVDAHILPIIKGPALSIYTTIVRLTRGWNQAFKSLSIRELGLLTGFKKDALLSGTALLQKLGIIQKDGFGNRASHYRLTDEVFINLGQQKPGAFMSNAFMLPNDLIDRAYLPEFKGPALSCYIVIVRKTRGWQKKSDCIGLDQFIELTGYNKDSVISGVNQLLKLGVITKRSFKNRPARYTLTDQIFTVGILEGKDQSAVGILESAIGISECNLSVFSTHNNNIKTILLKTNKGKKSFSEKACLTRIKKLSSAQIKLFADKLANHAGFGGQHAKPGESIQQFTIRLMTALRSQEFVITNIDALREVGFNG